MQRFCWSKSIAEQAHISPSAWLKVALHAYSGDASCLRMLVLFLCVLLGLPIAPA